MARTRGITIISVLAALVALGLATALGWYVNSGGPVPAAAQASPTAGSGSPQPDLSIDERKQAALDAREAYLRANSAPPAGLPPKGGSPAPSCPRPVGAPISLGRRKQRSHSEEISTE